jgi:hypothetical protein
MDVAAILKNRAQGHRDTTYAMLLALQVPDCLRALHQMVTTPHVGCWRDVRGVILHLEQGQGQGQGQGQAWDEPRAAALISGCVRMTNAQIRLDCSRGAHSWAAKWVPREPKCRKSLLLQWYYDALAADMFPGAPDAKRRYRQLVAAASPPPREPCDLTRLVKRALTETNPSAAGAINAAFMQHKRKIRRPSVGGVVPALSLAHSMGPGHNNCLHAGIGLALLVLNDRMITFSSHAQLHHVADPHDFVSNARYLAEAARAPVNGLNANLDAALNLARNDEALLIISDMEHDGDDNDNSNSNSNSNSNNNDNSNSNRRSTLFWNVSR